MTVEQKAEEKAKEFCKQPLQELCKFPLNWTDFDVAKEKCYITGFIDGYHKCQKEHEWHDLEKDPTDYPEDAEAKLVVIDYGALGWEYGIRANMNDPVARKDVIKWKDIE